MSDPNKHKYSSTLAGIKGKIPVNYKDFEKAKGEHNSCQLKKKKMTGSPQQLFKPKLKSLNHMPNCFNSTRSLPKRTNLSPHLFLSPQVVKIEYSSK